MPLVYRSVFTDSDGRITTALRPEFERWLGSKSLRMPATGLSQRGAALDSDDGAIAWAAALDSKLPNGDVIQRLRLVEESADARWVTTVAAVFPSSDTGKTRRARIWVDLEHEPGKNAALVRPGSPRIVRELLAVGEGYDGPVPLTSEDWTLTQNHVSEIAAYIVSRERSVPVIVFAYDGQGSYDQPDLTRRLARDVAGVAAVFRLADPLATEQLASSLPEGYAVYGGAMRTYLPGAVSDPDDVASRHRILGRASLVALGSKAFPAVKNQILELSTQRPAPVAFGPGSGSQVRHSAVAGPRSVSAAVLGVTWLRERLARMRRVLGDGADATEPALRATDDADAFDQALEELLSRAAAPSTVEFPKVPQVDPERLERLEREAAERRALEQLLDEAQDDINQRATRTKQLESALDDLTLEATEATEDVDRLERRIRWLERRVRDLGDSGIGSDDEFPAAPPSVAEVVVLAREHLHALVVGDIDETAAELDLHAGAQLYALKSWAAFRALDAYARARHAGTFQNSFYAWCQEPPSGEAAVSATAVAMGESETVNSIPDLRSARTFRVPSAVDSSGRRYMPAHIKVVKRGAPAPRLHFHDDAAGTGKVYVGYLGAHLPTARFP